MSTATLSSKSQVVLPADVRRQLGLHAGDRLVIDAEDGRVVIEKAPISFVDALEALGGELWHGYADELEDGREEWDR
ncbi:AbrB/MazE/SpoVT family DNA-binding domain-containing protein [Endothiovibrio diazotrophicus]